MYPDGSPKVPRSKQAAGTFTFVPSFIGESLLSYTPTRRTIVQMVRLADYLPLCIAADN
jgi:hypothetical protein